MVKNLKDIFKAANLEEKYWDGLEFRELIEGDRYISLPIPGDNSKSGSGFRNSYSLFQKIQQVEQKGHIYNSVELRQGRLIFTPEGIPVIKIE